MRATEWSKAIQLRVEVLRAGLRVHAGRLQWLHSLWALGLGVAVMLLLRDDFRYVRLLIGYLVLIWLASLILYWGDARFRVTEREHPKLRRVVLYVIQNFYHEMAFFLLPLYYRSTTLLSWNVVFLLLVTACAIMATFDMIYWRWLTRHVWLARTFYAVLLFAVLNIFLPVLFGLRNTYSLYLSGAAAALAYWTLGRSPGSWFTRTASIRLAAGVSGVLILLHLGRAGIPPSPLYLAGATFGADFQRDSLAVRRPVTRAGELGLPGRVYCVALVKAPVGIQENIGVVWYRDGNRISEGRVVHMEGGREEGFRLWSGVPLEAGPTGALRVDVVTAGGQLIGRALLPQ